MKDKIEDVFNSLQELDIKSTPHNVSIMNGVFDILRGIYQELEAAENAASTSGRDDNQ